MTSKEWWLSYQLQVSLPDLSMLATRIATRLITRQLEHFGGVSGKFSPRRKSHVGYGQK